MNEIERNNNKDPKNVEDDKLFKTSVYFCFGIVVTHLVALSEPQTSLDSLPLIRNLIGGGVFALAMSGTDKFLDKTRQKIEHRKQKNNKF